MPTNDSHNNRRIPPAGGPTSAHSAARVRTGDRSHPRAQENGSRSRTRFADRRRKRGRILIALTSICAIELVSAVLTAPALNVKHTLVQGITPGSSLTNQEIEITRNASSLPSGTNWLMARTGMIQKELASLPWFRSARVGRRLPTDLIITVEPRVPFYALITPSGRYEVAADNTPIRPLRREMENRLTPVFLNTHDVPKPGTAFADVSAGTAEQILHRTQSDAALHIAKIEIDRSTNIWLNRGTGVRINFGDCEDVDKKIAMMRRLLSHDQANRFAEINVSSPEWPAGRLRELASNTAPANVAVIPTVSHTTAHMRINRRIAVHSQSSIR